MGNGSVNRNLHRRLKSEANRGHQSVDPQLATDGENGKEGGSSPSKVSPQSDPQQPTGIEKGKQSLT